MTKLEAARAAIGAFTQNQLNLIAAAPELLAAAIKLRSAQHNYMAERGNEELGKMVGEAAAELDAAIAKAVQS